MLSTLSHYQILPENSLLQKANTMKISGEKRATITALSMMMLFLSFEAYANPATRLDRHPLPTKHSALAEPYQLDLSLSDYRAASPDIPYIALNIANKTQNRVLLFIWRDPQDVVYKAEYKAPTDDPNTNSDWEEMKPDIKAVPSLPEVKLPGDDGRTQSSSYSMRYIVKPGQTVLGPALPPNVPLSKQGFYRITAIVTVPEAREFDASVSQEPLLRVFTLTMQSKPLLIRRTATGFAEVPAVTRKTLPAR